MRPPNKRPTFILPSGSPPSSPPMTPGPFSKPQFPPQTSHTPSIYKRMGTAMLAQSPPLEFIEPIGQGPQFHFTRPQSRGISSRPSTASGRACATDPPESVEVTDSEEESDSDEEEEEPPVRITLHAEFVIEELDSDDSDQSYDSDIEVLLPDQYEDAKSEKSGRNDILHKLKELHCEDDSSDEEERERIYLRKKKRWSAGIFKRSHSQSVEGDSSYSDNDPLDDVDSNARRLRRRVRGPGDRRGSLIFIDKGYSNSNNIAEVEEPEDGVPHSQGPPSIPSDDGFTLDELPFWDVMEDLMDVEFESASN